MKPMQLDKTEVARYLGLVNTPLEGELEELARVCEGQLLSQIAPKKTGLRVKLEELPFWTGGLKDHLAGCREGYLFALTLGSEADRLLRLWSVEHMAKGLVGAACAAVLVDDLTEAYLQELEASLPEGHYLTAPFSPGYGDFSLHWQGEILSRLDASRRMGVSLTAGGMLVPEKTVTALSGISQRPQSRCQKSCRGCTLETCPYRKETQI